MTKEITISGMTDVKILNAAATAFYGEVGIHTPSSIIDAKSLLGLLTLCPNEQILCVVNDGDESFYNSIPQLIN